MLEFQTAWMAAEDAAKQLQLLDLCCIWITKATGKHGCVSCAACMLAFRAAWMAAEDAAKLLQLLVLCCIKITKAAGKHGCVS